MATDDTYRLTDEQAAEVERRLANPDRRFIPMETVKARFAQRAKERTK